MPAEANNGMGWQTGFQLALLLMAVPAQYLITNYTSVSPGQSQKALKDLVESAHRVSVDLFSWPAWQKWCLGVISGIYQRPTTDKNGFKFWTPEQYIKPDDFSGESPALEVMKHENPEGQFGNSPVVRSPRPSTPLYRVGQVITHRKYGYRGVIVGWDPQAKAPDTWLKTNHPQGVGQKKKYPNYAVLVDIRDRPQPQITYVAHENIQISSKTRIVHPAIYRYFDSYDGARYIARPALKSLYPDD